MKITKQLIVGTLLALLLVPAAAYSQDTGAPERGISSLVSEGSRELWMVAPIPVRFRSATVFFRMY